MNLDIVLKEFLNRPTNYRPYKKDTAKNLLVGGVEYSLLSLYPNAEIVPDELSESITDSVKGYSSTKDSAIDIYRSFIKFIKDKYNIEISIAFPPIPVSNTFERLMFISKYLQNPENKISDLENVLWLSTRSIEKDLAKLRGQDDPIQICGKKFIIPDTERYNDRIKFASTAHPFFLACNLTQVIAVLKGLKLICEEQAFKGYAMKTAKEVWQQLSDYARNRIIYVTENLLPDEVEWYKKLEDSSEKSFYTEYQCSHTNGSGILLDCLKNEKPCYIEYKDNDKPVFLTNCKVVPRSYTDENIKIVCEQGEKELVLNRILKSAYTIDELI